MATPLEGTIAQSPYAGRSAQMFPQLTAVQIARISAHGRKTTIKKGEVLAEPGDRGRMFVVLSGSIEVLQPTLSRRDPGHRAHARAGFPETWARCAASAAWYALRVRDDGEVLVIEERSCAPSFRPTRS